MKKILYLMALLLLIGCQEEELFKSKQGNVSVTASFDIDTRIIYTEDENVIHTSWNALDNIGLITDEQQNLHYIAQDNDSITGLLPLSDADELVAKDGTKVYAYYPFTSEVEGKKVALPNIAWQEYHSYEGIITKDFVYAVGEVKNQALNLQFKHLFAFLKLTIRTELLHSDNLYLYITATDKIANLFGYETDLDKFDLVSEEKILATSLEDGSLYFGGNRHPRIRYFMSKDELEGKSVVTCYIAVYPQPEGARITIREHDTEECDYILLSKDVPEGGLKAGHVYSLNIDESENDEIVSKEREALIAFYKATNGDQWTNNENWCSDKPLEEWYGVYTINGANVIDIDLIDNNLVGTIPPELAKLEHLESLYLTGNRLSGTLPANLGTLRYLKHFVIPNAAGVKEGLTGELPDFSKCELTRFSIDNHHFTGPLPECHWEDMEFFYMSNNNFTGTIPKSHVLIMNSSKGGFAKKRNEGDYNVSNNNLTGTIPDVISQHELFCEYWQKILYQKTGYGFNKVVIPAFTNTVKCYDGSFINLGEEYKKNKYTMLFNWGGCGITASTALMQAVSRLYDKYKEQGLGVIGMTAPKFADVQKYVDYMPNMKHFWQGMKGNVGAEDEDYDNNPYSDITGFYLFTLPYESFFVIVDENGSIIYWSDGLACPTAEYPMNGENIFHFVGNLFGNPDEDGSFDYYTSTDYSRDGEVVTLQKATVGKGIDLVFMGEAFVDTDMEPGGKYEQEMEKAMEQYFSIEPYKAFRNRFNVYAVKVVSPNAEFSGGTQHRINENDGVCFEYASKVPGINTDKWQVSVVYNTSAYAGRSYTRMYPDGTFVGYMMEGVNNVLNHEVGGHGFAKLLDEYVEGGNENLTLPDKMKENLDLLWEDLAWGANVDWRNDRTTVKWSRFLNDSRYANEGLGLYEGSYLYGYGAYRPTENSMMRYNDSPFNAPSREQIYKCIMQQSEGENWTYDYEKFVEYDAINRNATVTRALQMKPSEAARKEWQQRHRPPVFVKGTWRDAMKKQQRNTVVPLR